MLQIIIINNSSQGKLIRFLLQNNKSGKLYISLT